MTKPIPIVADIPTDEPGLGFPEYVEALSDAIRGGSPPQFTVGLYGAWGSGKTSLLRAIERTLKRDPSGVLTVMFDAWRHEGSEHIVVPLLHRIYEAAERSGDKSLTQQLRRALDAVLFSLNFTVAGIGVDTRAAKENWKESGLTPLDDAFSKPFREMSSLPDVLHDKRVVVLVDDLDRCSSEKVVSLLEAINLVMDVPGFIFVLALDYDVLVKAVTAKYPHVSGHAFIEKMVQLPFRVPPLMVGAADFLDQLIPEWDTRQRDFPDGFAGSVRDVADLGLHANPRQIKRLINCFLLLERIVERRTLRVDQALIAAMIGLQLRWPDEYEDLQDAILAGDENPFESLARSEEEDLVRYSAHFFSAAPGHETLLQLIQLTAVVAAERVAPPDSPPVRELRERMREKLLASLTERDFVQSSRSPRLWYRPDLPDFRVMLTTTGFRLEERRAGQGGRPWSLLLGHGFDYRHLEDGLKALDERVRKYAQRRGPA